MRKRILEYVIRRLCKTRDRKKTYRDLNGLKTVFVVFEAEHYLAAHAFIQQLEGMGKKVVGCGFCTENAPVDSSQIPYLILSKKDFNLIGKVSSEIQKNLQLISFDALIDLSLKDHLELECFIAYQNIPLKIGLKKKSLLVYDIAISDDSEKQKLSVEALEVHLLHYLHTIQHPVEPKK